MLVALLLALFIGLFVLLVVIIFAGPGVVKADLGSSCTVDEDCLGGLACVTGVCKAEIHEPCRVVSDCVAAATACYQGHCVAEPLGGPGEPGPCRAGLGLEYNMCRGLAGAPCTGDGMCFSELVCHNSTCQSAATVTALREQALRNARNQEEELQRLRRLEQQALDARQAEITRALEAREARAAEQRQQVEQQLQAEQRKQQVRTLVALEAHSNTYTDLLASDPLFDVVSATLYGQYMVLSNEAGATRVYDLNSNQLVPVLIKDRVYSLTLVNGFVTALNERNEVIQFQQEVIHRDGGVEWVSRPLNIKARKLHASPDGRYLVALTAEQCYIFDASGETLHPVHSFAVTPEVSDVIVNNTLRNIMVVTEKGIQINDTRFVPARYGCFTSEGRFATVPLEATHIYRSYVFNEVNYHIVARNDIPKLLESED